MRHFSAGARVAVAVVALSSCGGGDDDGAATSPAAPPTAAPARVLREGDPSQRMVALVIETGIAADGVEALLAVLREDGVRVSVAVTGAWAEAHPQTLRVIARDGHQLINGTYDERSWTGASTGAPALDARQRALSLSRTETTVYRLALASARPYAMLPHGDIDAAAPADAAAEGIGVILAPSAATDLRAGRIVAIDAASTDAPSLRALLAEAQARGLTVTTVAAID